MDYLTSDPEHAGVTDEQLEQFFADNPTLRPLAPVNGHGPMSGPNQFASGESSGVPPVAGVEGDAPDSTPQPEQEPDTGGDEEPTPYTPAEGEPESPDVEPAEAPETPPSPDDFYEFDGQRFPRSQVEAAAKFQNQLANDPQLQQLITTYLAGGESVPQPTPPAMPAGEGSAPAGLPPGLDLEDPTIAAIVGLIQQQNDSLRELRSVINATNAVQAQSQRAEINANWERASQIFAKDHGLEKEDVESLGAVAARLNVLPQLMSGIDPVTGAPSPPDQVRAFNRSLEIAMMMVPEYRDREFRRSVQTQQQEAKKRKLLGAVGGSSGSVARSTPPPRPGSPEAKRAMLAEVGAMLNGEWNDPSTN